MVESVDQKIKDALNEQYKALDPVPLLEKLKILQSKLFQYAWSCNDTPQETKESVAMMNNFMALPESKNRYFNIKKDSLDLAPKKRSFIIIDIARKMIATKDLETGKPEKILLNRYGTK